MLKLDSVSTVWLKYRKNGCAPERSAAVSGLCAKCAPNFSNAFSRSHSYNLLKPMICCRRCRRRIGQRGGQKFSSSFCAAMKSASASLRVSAAMSCVALACKRSCSHSFFWFRTKPCCYRDRKKRRHAGCDDTSWASRWPKLIAPPIGTAANALGLLIIEGDESAPVL